MIVLVHGWGYDARIWDEVRAGLGDLPTLAVDLGFFGEPRNLDPALWPDELLLGVGHSLGLPWLLRHARRRCPAMLAVNGFACFTARPDLPTAVPRRVVAAMARGFEARPGEVLVAFRQRCGAAAGSGIERADPPRLREGLGWLMDWDERPHLPGLRLGVLAGRADAIVPPAMTEAAFPGAPVAWIEDGHHLLPLQHPDRVASQIRRAWAGLPR